MNAYGALTPAQFVARLNQNTGGALTQVQADALTAELLGNNTTAGRASVLRRVAESVEVGRREKNRAFVLMSYFGYLRRDPESTGYAYWVSKLEEFNGDFRRAELVNSFISSVEYRQRFGQP